MCIGYDNIRRNAATPPQMQEFVQTIRQFVDKTKCLPLFLPMYLDLKQVSTTEICVIILHVTVGWLAGWLVNRIRDKKLQIYTTFG